MHDETWVLIDSAGEPGPKGVSHKAVIAQCALQQSLAAPTLASKRLEWRRKVKFERSTAMLAFLERSDFDKWFEDASVLWGMTI